MSEVTNCHYVSRFLTKAWEAKDRRLHYVDLKTNTLESKPSVSLFAVDNLHTTETERTFNRLVEDSVGKYKERCRKAGGRLIDPGDDQRMVRALIGLVALQSQRSHEALSTGPLAYTLDQMLSDAGAFDAIVDFFARDFRLIGGTLPAGEWFCYPSLGYFAIPLLDHPPAFAVPLTPNTFVMLHPREALTEHVESMVRTPHQVSTFAAIGRGLEHKLVIPARIVEASDPADLVRLVLFVREQGRRLFNLVGQMAVTAGLRGYGYLDDAP